MVESDIYARFASENVVINAVYTSAALRQLFSISEPIPESGPFRPGGYNSIWLLVTEHSSGGAASGSFLQDENTLTWQGQVSGRTDQIIIGHEERGLELLLFYRNSPSQFLGGGFRYMGRFEYQSHTGKPPTVFTLSRAGKAPSMAEVQAHIERIESFDPTSVREGREWVLATIVRRRGQAAFRSLLLDAYSAQCAVTGCSVEPILEAAHIIPYLGAQTHHIQNGLLLRADIHTLFDLLLLAINPETLSIIISPTLSHSEYAPLHGRLLTIPPVPQYRPSASALRAHRIRCDF